MYELIDSDATETIGIKIKDGEFEGTTFRFLNVKASEDEDSEEGLVSYSFEIMQGDQTLRENEDFHAKMSEILHELIIAAIDKHLPEEG